MPLKPEEEKAVVAVLAEIYRRVPWSKMRTRHCTWDIFNHRVRAAASSPSLGAFISRLCNYFGLQSLPPETALLLENYKDREAQILGAIVQEHIPICMKAIMMAKEMKENKGQQKLF